MKGKIALAVSILCLFASGCNYYEKKSGSDLIEGSGKSEVLSFSTVYERVLSKRCTECHSAAHGNKGKVNLETYAEVLKNIDDIKSDIEDGSMPKDRPPLSRDERGLILRWIAAGAPEFPRSEEGPTTEPTPSPAPSPTPGPIPELIDFKMVFDQVIEPACLKCHSTPENKGDVNLETYAQIYANRVDIEADVRDGSMPKKKSLSPLQRELILRWLAAGAREEAVLTQPLPPDRAEIDPTDPSDSGYSARTPEELAQLKRGKYIYNAGLCAHCHTLDPTRPQAGGYEIKSPFGVFYAPNISADKKTGIGRWSKADFLRALRKGVSPRGEYYYPSFPFQNYSKLTDRDVMDLRAYVLALPAVEEPNRPHQLQFPYNKRELLRFWRWSSFPSVFQMNTENFRLAQGPFVEMKDRDRKWNRGAYLVEGAFHCTQCHTPRLQLGTFNMEAWMAGSNVAGGSDYAPNLTPDVRSGLGTWRESDWIRFLQTGVNPKGENVGGEMRRIVLRGTARLTSQDQKAIAVYLMSLKAVR